MLLLRTINGIVSRAGKPSPISHEAGAAAPRAHIPACGSPGHSCPVVSTPLRPAVSLFVFALLFLMSGAPAFAADPASAGADAIPAFNVTGYVVEGSPLPATNDLSSLLQPYTGPSVSVEQIARAAALVQAQCREHGYPLTSVAVAREQITNGIVTLNLFQTAVPQVVISGVRYLGPANGPGVTVPEIS